VEKSQRFLPVEENRLRHVTAPELVVAGAEDCLTGVARAVALAQLFARSEIAVIERCGPYPWAEQPPGRPSRDFWPPGRACWRNDHFLPIRIRPLGGPFLAKQKAV